MFIFPIIYILSFIIAVREIYNGNKAGIFIFLIFGLSVYTTAMSVAFLLGLKDIIPFLQSFKELLLISMFFLNIVTLRYRPRFHIIDYVMLAYFGYLLVYAVLPIGELGFGSRLMALKSTSIFVIVYFTARLIDPKTVFINKYFSYIVILTIAAGVVVLIEVVTQTQLQDQSGYFEYASYFFNLDADGVFGLSTTFTSDSGYMRYASFFTNPLEHASATLLALSIIAGLYTLDNNRFKINSAGITAVVATIISILFAISRAPLASYFLMIYVYALITKRRYITNTIHFAFAAGAIYLTYLFFRFEDSRDGLLGVLMNTIDFSDPSSIGHVEQWVEGILAMVTHPLGMGLGSSGRVAGSLGDNTGGENQFIIIGVQAGIIALLLYLYIYILFVKTSLKWLSILKGKERKVCMTVLLLKVGLLIPLLTSEVESSSYLAYTNWFLSGLLVSIIMQPSHKTVIITPQPVIAIAS